MKTSNPQHAIIYCRVSSAKQTKEGNGLSSQETRCREYAKGKGYEVVQVFSDDVSGSLTRRRGMAAMLEFLDESEHGPFAVIIDDGNRLAREMFAHKDIRTAIASAGGILESPNMRFGDDADSEFQEYIGVLVAQHQRRKNAEQTKHRMRARVQNGYAVFQAPTGYKYVRQPGTSGKSLVRDEPVATVIQRALEGYASGEFQSQADVMRFLQDEPLFPKDRAGKVRNQRVSIIMRNWHYAGCVEAPEWGVSRRKGHHEPIVSLDTMQRVEERLNGINRAPYRKELSGDFPLRGFVVCDDCETPLTACWSKGSHGKYPYYLCPKRGCESYGKSIRREKIEGEFEGLLTKMKPSGALLRVATMMFKDAWGQQGQEVESQSKALKQRLNEIERQVSNLVKRIIDGNAAPSVITRYESEIASFEEEKLVVAERLENAGSPRSSFDDTLRTALGFLANPCNLWHAERLEDRHAVLKLAFTDRLRYTRNRGFRTANLSLPFKVLGDFGSGENMMAHPTGFETVTYGFRSRSVSPLLPRGFSRLVRFARQNTMRCYARLF